VVIWVNLAFFYLQRNQNLAEVIVIGSGTGAPSLRRGSPGLVILSENSTVLVDSGPGVVRKMLEAGLTYHDIDLLLYTHTHPDHVSDLVPFLFACKYADKPRQEDLLCAGGPGFKDFFEKLKNVYGAWIEPRSYRLTIQEILQPHFSFRDLRISVTPMSHLRESLGYRIQFESGKTIALSGDTDYCENLVDLASAVDLLILECSFPEGMKVEGHLTPTLAGRVAMESNCRRLLLTHLYPMCDQFDIVRQCSQVFQGEIILAEDLMRITI
jgi:ribonuclease BN (tRNA processing enzyme)